MNRQVIRGLVAAASLLTASVAFADNWSGAEQIASLISYGDGTRLFQFRDSASDTTMNPAVCSNMDHILPNPSMTVAQKEEAGRLLMSAYLAGKQVEVRLSSTACSNGAANTSSNGYRLYNAVWVK